MSRYVPVRIALILTLLAASFLLAAPTAAQDDAPLSGAETDWTGIPPAADCTAEPTTADDVIAALTAEVDEDEVLFPLTIPAEEDLPEGDEIDDETLEAVSAVMWEAVACLNGGDFGRFLAFLSPSGVRAFYFGILTLMGGTPATPTPDQIEELRTNFESLLEAEPTPFAEEESGRIDAIRDARELEDGRVLVLLDGSLTTDGTLFMVFSEIDDEWLIDAFGQIGEFPTPTP